MATKQYLKIFFVQATSFPRDYADAISQAQKSTKAALADGKKLVEVEFPAAGLTSVSGAAECFPTCFFILEHRRDVLVPFVLQSISQIAYCDCSSCVSYTMRSFS